jgi:hypothetical protein
MPYLARVDAVQEDARLAQESLGSVLLTLGGVILGMAAVLGIYDFADIREGTHLMLTISGGLVIIGLILMAVGEWKRSYPV